MNRSRLTQHLKRPGATLLPLAIACGLLAGCGDSSPSKPPTLSELCAATSPALKILGGVPCPSLQTSVARLELFDEEDNPERCSGVVLTPTKILTAAHCFNEFIFRATVFVGGESRPVVDFIPHPDFRDNGRGAPNDLAVALLKEPLNYPAQMVVLGKAPSPGDTLYVFGYGRTESGADNPRSDTTLVGGTMTVHEVTVSRINALYDGTTANTCRGDSGGPAFTFDDLQGELVLSGIVSSGTIESCGPGDVSSFTNLSDPSNLAFLHREAPEIFEESTDRLYRLPTR